MYVRWFAWETALLPMASGPRKMIDGYAYILPYKRWVNLGFYQGVDLADPEGLLEGTGAKMRHVKIRSLDDAQRPEVRALIWRPLQSAGKHKGAEFSLLGWGRLTSTHLPRRADCS